MALSKKTFPKATAAAAAAFDPLQNFETVTYTGSGSTQKITGYIRKGAAFNGSSSKILIGEFAGLNTSDYSVSLWFNHDSSDTSTNSRRLIQLNCSSAGDAGLFDMMFKQSTFEFTIRSGSTGTTILSYTSNATELPDDTWNHIAVTRDNTTNLTTLYINGTNVKEQTQAEGSTFGDSSSIGCRAGGDLQILGKIDQVRIFNTAITDSAKISQLAAEDYSKATKSTTDIFGDGSGVALYELDEDALSSNFEQAAVFNGSSSKVQLPSGVSVATGNNNFTLSAWVYLNSMPSSNASVITTQDNYYFYILIGSDGKVKTYNQNIEVNSAASVITTGQWYHIVATLDSTSGKNVYVNGNNVATSSDTSNCNSFTSGHNAVGYYSSNGSTFSYYLDGSIDQVRIFDTALGSSDVTKLYNESSQIPTANLVAHYKLDGGATDETGTYDGTASNVTYTNGVYGGTPTNVNFLGMAFQPDLIWVKNRDTTDHHAIVDTVRGIDISGSKYLASNQTNAEATSTNMPTSVESNGFTLSGGGGRTNTLNENYVAWAWKAGGTAVSNTDGTITSQVSANPDAGFSIVKYTGDGSGNNTSTTVGHGLSSAPELVIAKILDTSGYWQIQYAKDSDNLAGSFTSGAFINHSAVVPTSTVFNPYYANTSNNFITYCFHSVDGYQKIGSYTSPLSVGTKITTGFRPRFLLIKADRANNSWHLWDSLRDTTNPRDKVLRPNTSDSELDGSVYNIDFVDDGFEIENTYESINHTSATTYIYLAIA